MKDQSITNPYHLIRLSDERNLTLAAERDHGLKMADHD